MAKRKNWFSLFFTNYLGVLNDNFLKTLACFYLHCLGGEGERVDGGDAGIGGIGDTVFAVFPVGGTIGEDI
ncbi:MAG: hypothetical protein V8R91_21260 [Butyricimonas faecihominis]